MGLGLGAGRRRSEEHDLRRAGRTGLGLQGGEESGAQ